MMEFVATRQQNESKDASFTMEEIGKNGSIHRNFKPNISNAVDNDFSEEFLNKNNKKAVDQTEQSIFSSQLNNNHKLSNDELIDRP